MKAIIVLMIISIQSDSLCQRKSGGNYQSFTYTILNGNELVVWENSQQICNWISELPIHKVIPNNYLGYYVALISKKLCDEPAGILCRPFNDYYNFVIVNARTKLILKFSEEDFYFFYYDWTNNIWSPNGSYAIFPITHWGPFHIVKTDSLFKYYKDRKAIFRTVSASNYVPHRNHPAKGQEFMEWVDNNRFIFSAGCCGTDFIYQYNIISDEITLLKEIDVFESEIE